MAKFFLVLVSFLALWQVSFSDESKTPDEIGEFCTLGLTVSTEISNNDSFIIQTPNFGNGSYAENSTCNFVFISGDTPLIVKVIFRSLSLENDTYCSRDYLCVYGVRYCGLWDEERAYEYILPARNTFTIGFKTDESFQEAGSQLEIQVRDYENETLDIAASGVGSSPENVNTTSITLDELVYEDRCEGLPDLPEVLDDVDYDEFDEGEAEISTPIPDDNAVLTPISNHDSGDGQSGDVIATTEKPRGDDDEWGWDDDEGAGVEPTPEPLEDAKNHVNPTPGPHDDEW
ncbi:uncharacterized protein LOC131926987 [Physella acuta]|uniref:uncharacterized protein LOC131926987 n=1 Tax=Physella acuta TaxID=109671 RepID=UPI0027DAC684|nr:uncharacterized protein LOC131926987 [Physella acuta]